MKTVVEQITEQIKALADKEFEEFLSWFAEYEQNHLDQWDNQIHIDSQSGGELEAVLSRVRGNIVAGQSRLPDEIINNS